MSESDPLSNFRADVRTWLSENFPPSLKNKSVGMEGGADGLGPDLDVWRERLAKKGWGAPTWPKEYGGAGLEPPRSARDRRRDGPHRRVQSDSAADRHGRHDGRPDRARVRHRGSEARHLPGIASGAVRWCLGLSEPNAGSDLASLRTKAEDKGDQFVVNGQKTWTSGADISQWCGALVRTDPKLAKHDGISFLLLPMDQPGVRTRPIKLIAGASPFCETFFDNAIAEKNDLLGKLNDGWNVVKRLLQHERQSQTGGRGPGGERPAKLEDLAKRYVGTNDDGTLADADLRTRLTSHLMDAARTQPHDRAHHRGSEGQGQRQRRGVDSQELGHARGANALGTDARTDGRARARVGRQRVHEARKSRPCASGCSARPCRFTAARSKYRTTSSPRTSWVSPRPRRKVEDIRQNGSTH